MIGSPYYWALVAAITVAFAVVDVIALSRREMGRAQGVAIAVYVATWAIVVGLSLPIAPLGSLWWVFPAAVRIAVAAMFAGGQFLAGAFRVEQSIVHPEQRPKPVVVPKHKLTEEELRVAEAFDAQWQLEDRQRNHDRELLERGRRNASSRHADSNDHVESGSGLGNVASEQAMSEQLD